ncbi:MAG: tRNA-guanine transglycosylase, partial [Gammaproteobacteria bacterium]
EHIQITNSQFKQDPLPISEDCGCQVCQKYSKAYLHHLFKAKELLGMSLLTIHNIFFMNEFMKKIREKIKDDSKDSNNNRAAN